MKAKPQQFRRGSNKLVTCRMCGKQTHSNIDGCHGLDLCRPCREQAEMDNEHSDGHHEGKPNPNCPHCKAQDTTNIEWPKIEARLICGSTFTTKGFAEAEATLHLKANIHHTKLARFVEAAPDLLHGCKIALQQLKGSKSLSGVHASSLAADICILTEAIAKAEIK